MSDCGGNQLSQAANWLRRVGDGLRVRRPADPTVPLKVIRYLVPLEFRQREFRRHE